MISSGIHGNETAPIELCSKLIKQVLKGKVALKQRVFFIFGNPCAINQGTRFVEQNLNNLFSLPDRCKQESTQEQQRASAIEVAIRNFFEIASNPNPNPSSSSNTHLDGVHPGNFHLDLHTAIRGSCYEKFAISPYLHEKPHSKTLLIWLDNFDVTTVLLANKPTNALGYFSFSQCQANAITIELGKVKPFGENEPNDLHHIRSSLYKLLQGEPLSITNYREDRFTYFETAQVIIKKHDNFTLEFADDVKNFTAFNQGELLANDGNDKHKVKEATEFIVFPNANVALNQRALLTVIKCMNINML